MATKKNLKLSKPQLKQPDMAPIDAVRNPNYDIAMAQKNYENNLAQSIANSKFQNNPPPPPTDPAMLAEYNKFMANRNRAQTSGGLGGLPMDQAGITPELRKQLDEAARLGAQQDQSMEMAARQGMGVPPQQGPMGGQVLNPQEASAAMANIDSEFSKFINPNPAMNQMADYNKMLQQGTQRNQDMNQAAQNLAGIPRQQKSFSQVAGGIGRMNRMSKKPRPSNISPSNQKLF
jgi:hypothetical protein